MREALGLPDTATEVDVLEAARRLHELEAETPPAGPPPADPEEDDDDDAADDDPDNPNEPPVEAPPTTASAGGVGTVTMDAATVAALKRDAQAGAKARKKQIDDERAALVAAAVADGRIPPSRAKAWRKQLDADEGSAIGAREPGAGPGSSRTQGHCPHRRHVQQRSADMAQEWLSAAERERIEAASR